MRQFILRSLLGSVGGDQRFPEEWRIICHRIGRVNLVQAVLAVLCDPTRFVYSGPLWVDSMRIRQLQLRLGVFVAVLLALSFPGRARTEDAQSHADMGIQFARSGDMARAAEELRRAVMLAPTNAQFLSTLGTVLAMDKKLEESTHAFRKALQFAPQDSTSRRYLAANLWQLHRYPEAKRELQIILREHPNDAPSRLLLGMVSQNSGDYATAAKMLSSVPQEIEKQPESIAALASSYYHLKEREKARATIERLSSLRAIKPVLLAAQIADQAGDFEESERLLNSITGAAGDSPDIQFRKANVQYHAGHFAQCQTTLEPLLAGPGGTAQMYNLMGWCYHRLKKPKEATEAFEHAIALTPADESNYLDLIKVLEAHYFLRVALDAANRGVALFPKSVAMLNLKGSIERRMFHFNDAVTSYKQAIQVQDTNVESWLGLVRAQISAESISEATSTLKLALERFPNEARLKVIYAVMLLTHADAGDRAVTSRAEQMLGEAIKNDPNNFEAFFELGKIELSDGKLTQACQHLERAVKLSPQSSEPHFVLWRAYQRLNRKADAARELKTFELLKQ
jgi:tetratricopeptide (TPR) repeat protein